MTKLAPGEQSHMTADAISSVRPRRPIGWLAIATAGSSSPEAIMLATTEAGRHPHDRQLHDLVGELSTRSEDFRTLWGSHNVRHHGSGTKRFNHPVVGELTLVYEGLELAADPGLTLTIYAAEPGSASAERLQLLGSWAASNEESLVRQPSKNVRTHGA